MEQTTKYEMFKRHTHNRPLDELTIGKLQKSISMKNLLEFRPILVNSKMEVIDGQHRLEAAKRLAVPIFYQIEKESNSTDILLLNANQKPWTKQNFFEFFLQEGKDEYMKLKRFIDKYDLTLKEAAAYLKQHAGQGTEDSSFRLGKYKFPQGEELMRAEERILQVQEVIGYLKEKIVGTKMFLATASIVRALCSLMNYDGFSFDVFMKKLPYRMEIIHPCSREMDYVEMFKAIYNWKNQNPLT